MPQRLCGLPVAEPSSISVPRPRPWFQQRRRGLLPPDPCHTVPDGGPAPQSVLLAESSLPAPGHPHGTRSGPPDRMAAKGHSRSRECPARECCWKPCPGSGLQVRVDKVRERRSADPVRNRWEVYRHSSSEKSTTDGATVHPGRALGRLLTQGAAGHTPHGEGPGSSRRSETGPGPKADTAGLNRLFCLTLQICFLRRKIPCQHQPRSRWMNEDRTESNESRPHT